MDILGRGHDAILALHDQVDIGPALLGMAHEAGLGLAPNLVAFDNEPTDIEIVQLPERNLATFVAEDLAATQAALGPGSLQRLYRLTGMCRSGERYDHGSDGYYFC